MRVFFFSDVPFSVCLRSKAAHDVDTFGTPGGRVGDGGWHLSSKTVCPDCGKRIRRGHHSYSCGADGVPRHFYCVYPEMAVSAGIDDEEGSPSVQGA